MRDVTFTKHEFQSFACTLRSYTLVGFNHYVEGQGSLRLTVDELCGALAKHDRALAAKVRTWHEASLAVSQHVEGRCNERTTVSRCG